MEGGVWAGSVKLTRRSAVGERKLSRIASSKFRYAGLIPEIRRHSTHLFTLVMLWSGGLWSKNYNADFFSRQAL